ncbi:MAG: HNH endonuclease [Acidimicrobiales bacterium]
MTHADLTLSVKGCDLENGVMSLGDLSDRAAVINAIREYDVLGRDAFLAKYGYEHARSYFLEYEGRHYDSNAIIGVAHGYQFPELGPLAARSFSGGAATVERKLQELGFHVISSQISQTPNSPRSERGHMDFWVGVTNPNWFSFLSSRGIRGEVNFWQPSSSPPTVRLKEGSPFLFKLKSPYHHIVGGGFFLSFTTMPLWLAWEIFQEANGFATSGEMIADFARLNKRIGPESEIGCTVLTEPFYFPKSRWIDVHDLWAPSIQRGKGYSRNTAEGDWILNRVFGDVKVQEPRSYELDTTFLESAPFGGTRQAWGIQRIGQSGFRTLLLSAYERRCAITGENTLDTLEAAHIRPFADEESHDVRNGLLLRADFHRLYDRGLVSVTPDLEIRVSPKIHDRYFNGKAYYRVDGQPLQVIPKDPRHRPDPERLDWHFTNRFQSA